LKPQELEEVSNRLKIRSLVRLFGNTESRLQFCQQRDMRLYVVALHPEQPPAPSQVRSLVEILRDAPRPVLIEGHRGTSCSGLASALALLLDGQTPEKALGQFSFRYGQFGGPEISKLAGVIRQYESWLAQQGSAHDAHLLCLWAGTQSDEVLPLLAERSSSKPAQQEPSPTQAAVPEIATKDAGTSPIR
jgi:hypothetical protein